MKISHPIPPLYNNESKILLLGSFPSVKSREVLFFYGHPQNRFWKVISTVLNRELPKTIEEKRELLLSSKIALWDVIGECEINGSSDSSIKNAKANNISIILRYADIKAIFTNGKKAHELFVHCVNTFPAFLQIHIFSLLCEWGGTLGLPAPDPRQRALPSGHLLKGSRP